MNDPALLELFTCLREAGFSLGLAEYHLLLQAVHAGFGTRDRSALAQLCCALWVKSEREKQIFQDYFDQLIPEQPEQIFFETETENTGLKTNQQEQLIYKIRKTSRSRSFLLLGLTTFIVAIGGAFFLKDFIPKPKPKPQVNSLVFSGGSFLTPSYIVDAKEKTALIKITRTGSRYGAVSAKLSINQECFPDVSGDTSSFNETSKLVDNPQSIQFADGEVGEKIILLPIILNEKANFFQKTITLCLTEPIGIKLGEPNRAMLLIQNQDYLNKIFRSDIFELVLITFTCVILLLVAWRMWKTQQIKVLENEGIIPETYTNLPKTLLSPDVMRTMADEIQVAKAIRYSDNQLSELFPLIVNDLPVTHRQLKQGWRYLRQLTREGAPSELDLEATIQQVAQQGFLLSPELIPRRTNRIELLLLIDRDGSMVPFHHLSQGLADTASRGGRFSRVRIYYFHNCPDEYLYRDPYHLEAEPIDDCLLNLPKVRTVCLIFSDAGAARGGFSSKRRRLTKFFLKELKQHISYIAWLNPVPRKRWENTTAQDIAALVPMFEVNRQEFYKAINILRGRHKSIGEAFR
ncbi:hypothetical protein [Scytonema sp. NUACC26]|uniref:hypothetical protein n=1 Tax=Scytonema sp. NUACC26 TaxID=3140176 RepID=UPI0034DC1632